MRFSPACAGNRPDWLWRIPGSAVQPRVCGEQLSLPGPGSTNCGSAPRVRGTGGGRRGHPMIERFSPACAGNRRGLKSCEARRPVQPRVCGEQWALASPAHFPGGSAPRVRGTVRPRGLHLDPGRFSPACAGNSCLGALCRIHPTVQPRVCGEQAKSTYDAAAADGSAPRVRGTVELAATGKFVERFSPACAGNRASLSYPHHTKAVQPRVCGEQTSVQHVGRTTFFTCQRAPPNKTSFNQLSAKLTEIASCSRLQFLI